MRYFFAVIVSVFALSGEPSLFAKDENKVEPVLLQRTPPKDHVAICESKCDEEALEDRQRCLYRYLDSSPEYSDCIAPIPRRTRLCKLRCE